MVIKVLLIIGLSLWSRSGLYAALPLEPAKVPEVQGPPSDQFWSMGATGRLARMKGSNDHEVRGFAASVQFGYTLFLNHLSFADLSA